MCGIAGLINLSGRLSKDEMAALAARMSDCFQHRGPDDSGVWVSPDGRCALSQRRLSIIDLSPAGHQPMIHEATGSALSFNGEIYNYRDLRPALEEKGSKFTGSSDTEILLHGLAASGASYIEKLDGMFAFAFYDPEDKSLLLARDIFGEKPLYYARTKDWFAFASELSALTILPGFDNGITLDRIATYFMLQYLPAPQTIYQSTHKLPPGHWLRLDAAGQEEIVRHFHFKASSKLESGRSLDDLADELEAILDETVQTRMIADVPLGAFLSGGVDSSTIVALASKHSSRPIQTFSIGFEGSGESEHEAARAMAAHLKTDHRDQILSLHALELGRHVARILDEPNGDSSCLPTWILSKFARQHVTVALSGDGGDELFGGYGRYLRTLQDSEAGDPNWKASTNYYSPRILVFSDQAIEKFIGFVPPGSAAFLAHLRAPLDQARLPLLQRLRETDVENYMPGAVLAKVDRMSMQHALEVRAPLLGRKVADFAMNMAANDLCTATHSKRVLKQLAARYIPRDWLEQPKKGFGLPVQGWGGSELTEEVSKLLTSPDSCLARWIEPTRLEGFLAYHRATPQTYQLWAVFVLELWLRSHPHHVV